MTTMTTFADLQHAMDSNHEKFMLTIAGDFVPREVTRLANGFRAWQSRHENNINSPSTSSSSLRCLWIETCQSNAPISWDDFCLLDLFDAIGAIQSITHLRIATRVARNPAIPMRTITTLLEKLGPRLVSIEFYYVNACLVSRRSATISRFNKALLGMKCLRNFVFCGGIALLRKPDEFSYYSMIGGMIADDMIGDPFAFSSLPMLVSVDFVPMRCEEAWHRPDVLCHLLTSRKLRKLEISEWDSAIMSSEKPFVPESGEAQSPRISMLQKLPTSYHLKELGVFFEKSTPPDGAFPGIDWKQWGPAFSALLETNKGVEELRLDFDGLEGVAVSSETNQILVEVVNILLTKQCPSLKAIRILSAANYLFRNDAETAILDLLRSEAVRSPGVSLEVFDMLGASGFQWSTTGAELYSFRDFGRNDIDFFLHLNRTGRKRVLETSSTMRQEDWLEIFDKFSDDIQVLYYYLRLHPTGWCPIVLSGNLPSAAPVLEKKC